MATEHLGRGSLPTGRSAPTDPAALVGGEEHREIVPRPHDPAWATRYEAEARTLVGALGDRARRVEHVGSTSVPDLVAKPVVDVLLVVTDADDEQAYLQDLLAAGYLLRVREPGHRMVRTPALDVHVHVYGVGSPQAAAVLRLRDRLRRSVEDRDLYARTKMSLARRDWPTMNHYADAKSDVVQEILSRADGTTAP